MWSHWKVPPDSIVLWQIWGIESGYPTDEMFHHSVCAARMVLQLGRHVEQDLFLPINTQTQSCGHSLALEIGAVLSVKVS